SAAAFWHVSRRAPRERVHVLGLTGLSVGVLAACFASPWDTGDFLSFHALTASWVLLGFAFAAAGSVSHSLRATGLAGPASGDLRAGRFAALFPIRLTGHWLEGVGVAVVALALRGGWDDPWRPYSSVAAVVCVSVLVGALAFWFRRAYP